MPSKRLEGQRALVTGASSGIGAAIARRLAREGADLVVTARRADRLTALAGELRDAFGVDVRVLPADLSDPAVPPKLFEETEGQGLPIDILVNNAGIGLYRDFIDCEWPAFEQLLRVNAVSVTHMTQLWLPKMIDRGRGHVMNIASVGAFAPTPGFAAYAATKAYVRNLTEAIDHELSGTGVRATCICPGGTYTEFMEQSGQKLKPVSRFVMMSADRCATIAVNKMLRGRRTVITGRMNALGMFLMRFVPRVWMPTLSRWTLGSAVERVAPTRRSDAA
jgi:uncharacterized protein